MFDELRAETPLRAVYWKDLRPGLVFAGGLSINGVPPAELAGFPVLTSALVSGLHLRYKLSPEKKVLVYGGDGGLSPQEFSGALRAAQARLPALNGFRGAVRELKALQPDPSVAVWDSAMVERGTLIWPLRAQAPSFLADLARDVGIADVLTREVFTRLRLPADRPAAIHLAVDESYSMAASGKDPMVRGTADLFRGKLARLLPCADATVYAFSEECRVVAGPLRGAEVRRAGTDYACFVPPLLRRLKEDRPNLVLLFTDGLPEHRRTAERALERLAAAGVFYAQIVFNLRDDRRSYAPSSEVASLEDVSAVARELSPEEYRAQEEELRRGFGELARAAGGSQLILTADDALSLAAVEVFDRWYGGLSN